MKRRGPKVRLPGNTNCFERLCGRQAARVVAAIVGLFAFTAAVDVFAQSVVDDLCHLR